MTEPILQIENFRMCFNGPNGPVHAVHDVNLTVHPGEVLALVGESGSGKTALCRAILMLHSAHARYLSGKIILNGTDVLRLDEDAMMQIRGTSAAMVFQDPLSSLNPVFRISEQLAEPMRQHSVGAWGTCGDDSGSAQKMNLHRDSDALARFREQEIELLRSVGLDYPEIQLDKYPHQLSGGQRQRVAIALALACNPSLVIADEPTTSLDAETGKMVMNLLRQLAQEQNKGVLFVTHDIALAREIADRIAVMKSGEIIEKGDTLTVFEHPVHEYTKQLVGFASDEIMENCEPHDATETCEYSDKLMDEFVKYSESIEAHVEPNSDNVLLRTENLTFSYRTRKKLMTGTPVIRNLNLTIYRGEILGLVGESGCGKTTLARLLTGILKPTAGSVYWNEELLQEGFTELQKCSAKGSTECFYENSTRTSGYSRRKQRTAQLIFQDSSSAFNERMLVEQIIEEPLRIQRIPSAERQAQVREMAEQVGLAPELLTRHPYEISGGQRQRVAIARALITKPIFLIADEPVSSLDVPVQAEILQLLRELRDKCNLTILLVGHNVPMVKRVSDRIIRMGKDEIIER